VFNVRNRRMIFPCESLQKRYHESKRAPVTPAAQTAESRGNNGSGLTAMI
jgi:hypothetical protein